MEIIIKDRKDMEHSRFERGYDPQESKERGLSEKQIEAEVFHHTRDVVHTPHEQRKLYDEFYDKNKE